MPWYWPFGGEKSQEPTTFEAPAGLRRKRMYAAAGYGRTLQDWVASSTSQDAEARLAIRTIRNRARQLARDNDYVKNAIRQIRNNVIGQGVNMQSQVRVNRGPGAGELDKRVNALVEDEWRKWKRKDSCHTAGMLSFHEIERLLMGSVARDGEVFVRMITERMGRSKVPLALEIIEPDLLDENLNGTWSNGNEIRMGVEVNKWYRPVAYHFFTKHPGELLYGGTDGVAQRRIRVPAEEVIHLFVPDRAHQTRGISWFDTAMIRLRHMTGYEEAEVIAARTTACQMGFITTPDPDYEPADTDIMDYERVEDFSPGKITTLAPGEQFQAFNPTRPSGLLDPFMRYMLRAVAAGIGMSYGGLSKDYSQTNYSSSRLDLLDERETWRTIQNWMIDTLHQRVFERFLELGVLAGALSLPRFEIDADAYTNPRWIPRGWSWVDPTKEIQAYKAAVRAGFMTQSEVVAQNGGDFEELAQARSRELELCEELELVFDTDPELVSEAGQAQPNNPLEPPSQEAAENATESSSGKPAENSNE